MTTDEFIPDAIRVILRPYLVILPYGHFRKTLTFYIVNVRVMYKSSSFEIFRLGNTKYEITYVGIY